MTTWGTGRSALFAATVAIVACSTPEAPTLAPKSMQILGMTSQGMSLQVTLEARNPNAFSLSARSVKARVVLDGTTDLGEVTVPTKVTLPKKAATSVAFPVEVKWGNVAGVALLAAAKPVIPYRMTGTANVGGEGLNVDLPFTIDGTMTREELLKATATAIPTLPF